MKTGRVRKRCDTCGKTAMYREKARVCRFSQRSGTGFRTGWRCPGKVARVTRPTTAKTRPTGYEVAKGKHAAARKMVEQYSTALRRTATLLHKWIRKERYYSDRMAEAAERVTIGMDESVLRKIVVPE